MFVRLHCLILALVSTTIPVVAQTFFVDGSNGPGTNFTGIPAAVMNVPLAGAMAIPMQPALRGAKLVLQAATLGSGGLRATNPSLSVVT